MKELNEYLWAPELQVTEWLNTNSQISIKNLLGKVIVIEAFQILCPGCVLHGLPQAKEIAQRFSGDDVVVLGLHSVFEHHDAMKPVSLRAFLHEYDIDFPVAIDCESDQENERIPKTMRSYELRGTPSLIVIDRIGRIRINHFGRVSDMQIATEISKLLYSDKEQDLDSIGYTQRSTCTPEVCN